MTTGGGTAPITEFIPLVDTGEGALCCTVAPHLARPDGGLYGGAAAALAVTAAERATGRRCLSLAIRYLAPAALGDEIRVVVTNLSAGRSISQVEVKGTHGDRLIFAATAAAAVEGSHDDDAQLVPFPDAPAPSTCRGYRETDLASAGNMWRSLAVRVAHHDGVDVGGQQPLRLWARINGVAATPATMAYVSDWVSEGFWQGVQGAGTGVTIDGSITVAQPDPTEWILMEILPQSSWAGYCAGQVLMWSENGVFLGTATQTVKLRRLSTT